MTKFTTGPEYSAHSFNWKGKHGTADASDLRLPPGKVPYGQVYHDAADAGLTLVNNQRNSKVNFIFDSFENGKWKFTSLDKQITITIFND